MRGELHTRKNKICPAEQIVSEYNRPGRSFRTFPSLVGGGVPWRWASGKGQETNVGAGRLRRQTRVYAGEGAGGRSIEAGIALSFVVAAERERRGGKRQPCRNDAYFYTTL
jgi:hypothetical protein